MHVKLPGLLKERNSNGSTRWRVRMKGNKSRRTSIPVGPGHPDFLEHYHAGRAGQIWEPGKDVVIERSIDWLAKRYLDYLEKMVAAGHMSKSTLKQRRSVLNRLCDHKDSDETRYGECDMNAPTSAFIALRDAWADRPGAADNMIKVVSAVYQWAVEREEMPRNPLVGISAINRHPSGGETPWTPDDLLKFKQVHHPGSMAYLWLTLQAFTACGVGEAAWIGPAQEKIYDGQLYLEWQPRKKGSAFVSIPMLPPLIEAVRVTEPKGETYILTSKDRPFSSADSLRNQVRKWCDLADLSERTSHGIRKATAEMMAEAGCAQHQM